MTFSKRVRFLFTMLQKSSQDLLIFIIVLFVFFLAFGMAAFLSFSSDVSDFRSLSMSILNLMRYTVTELDYVSIRNSNRFLGNFFYVIWSVLMILILANVFIAILSEAYATISTETDDEGEIFTKLKQHLKESVQSIQNGKKFKHMSLGKIFKQADKNNDGKLSDTEIAEAMNIEKDEAQNIISEFDQDGDNKLNKKEVRALTQSIIRNESSRNIISKKAQRTDSINEKLEKIEKLLQHSAFSDKND